MKLIPERLERRLPLWLRERPQRLDRGRMYMTIMLGVWVTSLSVLFTGPLVGSSVGKLSHFTLDILAGAMWLGSSLCCWGFVRGNRFYNPGMMNPTTLDDLLDLRHSYAIAQVGVPAVVASMATYVWAIISHASGFWPSALSASLAVAIIAGSLWNSWDFHVEIRRLDSLAASIKANQKE